MRMSSSASEIFEKSTSCQIIFKHLSEQFLLNSQTIFGISATVSHSSIKFCSNGFGISSLGTPFPESLCGQQLQKTLHFSLSFIILLLFTNPRFLDSYIESLLMISKVMLSRKSRGIKYLGGLFFCHLIFQPDGFSVVI